MTITTGSTNVYRRKLVRRLLKLSRETNHNIWRTLSEELSKPRRRRRAVNVSRINRYASDDEIVFVPGKVLGAGTIEKKVTVVAESFSSQAMEKILKAGGKTILFYDLVRDKELLSSIDYKKTRIIG